MVRWNVNAVNVTHTNIYIECFYYATAVDKPRKYKYNPRKYKRIYVHTRVCMRMLECVC